MKEYKKRSITIDEIRGGSILLVVLGHVIQILNPNNYDDFFIFRVIYSFHMPLFMIISGLSMYVCWIRSENKNIGLLKRAARLVLPFFIWTLIHCLLKGNRTIKEIIEYFLLVIIRPDMELWFLWILFLNSAFFAVILRTGSFVKSEYRSFTEMFLILFFEIILERYSSVLPGLYLCGWHFKFFAMVFLFGKYKFHFQKYSKKIFCVSAILFIFLIPYWFRTKTLEVPVISENFIRYNISSAYFNILLAMCGSYFFAYIMACLPDKSKIKQLLAYLGQHTIEIYILSNYFIHNFFEAQIGNYLICFLLAVWVPVIIKKALDNIPYVSLLLFGDNRKSTTKKRRLV